MQVASSGQDLRRPQDITTLNRLDKAAIQRSQNGTEFVVFA